MPEDRQQLYWIDAADQPADDRRQEAARARGGKPDEWETSAFRSRLCHNRLITRDFTVQWRIPSVLRLAFCVGSIPPRCGVYVHPGLYRLVAPQENEYGKNQERQPRFERLSKGVGVNLRSRTARNSGDAATCRNHPNGA